MAVRLPSACGLQQTQCAVSACLVSYTGLEHRNLKRPAMRSDERLGDGKHLGPGSPGTGYPRYYPLQLSTYRHVRMQQVASAA